MLTYAKKRAVALEMTLLYYIGAFGAGVSGERVGAYRDGCPKLLRAYRDGVRMKKKALTQTQDSGSIGITVKQRT